MQNASFQTELDGLERPAPPVRARVRGRSWSILAPDGAYSEVPAWPSGGAWFDALMDAVTSEEGKAFLEAHRVSISVDTLLRVARADWLAADARTGRGVTTSHQSVATELGMSARTVRRAREVIQDLGFATTIVFGRHLTAQERELARERHGGHQDRAASVRAMTMPRPTEPVENVHPPRRGSVKRSLPVKRFSPTRAGARATAAPRPEPRQKRPRPGRKEHSPRPVALQKLAWQVAWHYRLALRTSSDSPGSLIGGRHIGHLCNILSRHGVTPDRYSLSTLKRELDAALQQHRVTPLENHQKRDPLANFAWTLRFLASERGQETLLERQMRERAERAQARLHAAQERAAEEARIGGLDVQELDAIKRESDARIAELNRTNPALRALRRSNRLPYLPGGANT